MESVIMSIKPQFVDKILTGEKTYEYRKNVCRRSVRKIYIYSTVPVKRIVGEAEIDRIIVEKPEKLWEMTKKSSGIDKVFYDEYFRDREVAVAYKLKNIIEYSEMRLLREFGIETAPQSYRYVNV